MKRTISILLSVVLCAGAFLPITTYAETYNLGGTDMSISVDDTVWYVFTRDNIKNNSELEELGITYEAMYEILHNNEAYMDAFASKWYVLVFYFINLVMVLADLALYVRNVRLDKERANQLTA